MQSQTSENMSEIRLLPLLLMLLMLLIHCYFLTSDQHSAFDLSHLKHWLNMLPKQAHSIPLASCWIYEYQQARCVESASRTSLLLYSQGEEKLNIQLIL